MSLVFRFDRGAHRAASAVVAIAGLFCGSLRAADDFATTVLATNPLAFYRLDGPSGKSEVGTTRYKSMGGVTSADPGLANDNFAKLNGKDGYIVTTQAGGITSAASIMAWVNLEVLPSDDHRFFYVAGESQSGNDLDVQFETDNVLRFYTAGGSNVAFTPAPATLAHQWHMIVATADASTRARVIYWDGKLVASDKDGGIGAKRNTFTIGGSTVFSGRFLDGGVEEAALWNRALTAREIATIYAAGTSAKASAGTASAGASAPSTSAGGTSPFPTNAKVELGDGTVKVNMKREEQIAYMFLTAIQQIESDCQNTRKAACGWDQVLPRLKYDLRKDPNYNYTLQTGGLAWEGHANPKKPGLGGFYFFSLSFPSVNVFYNAAGTASVVSKELTERSIEGDSFMR